MKETNRAKTIWRNEDQQDWDSVEQQLSVQDPRAHAQPKQKRTRDQPKTVKSQEAKNFSKSEAKMVDVMDTPARDFNHREGDSQDPYILQKGIDARNTNNAMVALITRKTSLSIAFIKQCPTEQITDVSCGNTAALVGLDQFF